MRNGRARIAPRPELIEAINKKLEAFPGIIFNYTQPAEDAVDEAETGLKSSLAVKVFGSDLNTLEQKGKAIKQILEQVRGISDVTLVQELGQPSLTINIDRAKIARYGVNVADINGLIQAAIGGDVATQVVQEEKQFDLVVRLERDTATTRKKSATSPSPRPADSKSRSRNSRTSRSRTAPRLSTARTIPATSAFNSPWKAAISPARWRTRSQQVKAKVTLPQGYRLDWGGEYTEYTASRAQLSIILPLTLFLIFLLLFALYSNFKFPFITVLGVLLSAPIGGIVAFG